jgi:hypothetical protein
VEAANPVRIDHVRLSNPLRTLNGVRWFFTHRGSREAWLMLMDTGEVRLYDKQGRTLDLQGHAPILIAASPRDVESKLRMRKVRIRVGNKWRRVQFTGREKGTGVEWMSMAGHAGEMGGVAGLGPLGEVLEWTTGGFEHTRNTRRRRAAHSAWKSVLSGRCDWSAVPSNVEPVEAAPAKAGEAPMSTA